MAFQNQLEKDLFSQGLSKTLAGTIVDAVSGISYVNTITSASITTDGVTDVGDDIRALITQAKLSATATNRVLLKIYPGTYMISGELDLGSYVDLDMRGATFKFTGNTDTTKLKIGNSTGEADMGHYVGLNVYNNNVFYYPGHKYKSKQLIGIEFLNVVRSEIQIHDIKGFTIGVRFAADAQKTPGPGTVNVTFGTRNLTSTVAAFNSNMVGHYIVSDVNVVIGKIATYVSPTSVTLSANAPQTFANSLYETRLSRFTTYNNITVNQIRGCKYAVNIHSYDVESWVNENKFFGGNIATTSDLDRFGSGYGLYFSAENSICYLNGNNNVWISPCFQLGSPMPWVASGTGWQTDNIVYNPTTFNEYRITTATTGTLTLGTVAPTHTSGTVNDGLVNLQYIGPCRRSPIFYDGAGAQNRTIASRWEGGFGAYMVASPPLLSTNYVAGNRSIGSLFEVDVKAGVTNPLSKPDIDENCFANTSGSYADNEIVSYRRAKFHTIEYTNLHKKAIESANGTTVPGFDHTDFNGAVPLKSTPTGSIEILYDGLHFKTPTAHTISLVLNTNTSKRFEFNYSIGQSTANAGMLRVRLYDSSKTYFTDLTTNFRAWGALLATNALYYSHSAPTSGRAAIAVNPEVSWTRVFIQGETTSKAIITGFTLTAKNTDLSKTPIDLVTIENSLPLNPNLRYSNGTPIAGVFLTTNEQIINLDTTTGQPLYWTVTVPGYLAKAWVANTAYIVGNLVSNSGTVYRCILDHTASISFAADSTNWVSLGTSAILTAKLPDIATSYIDGISQTKFIASDFSGTKTASTTISGQSEPIVTGVSVIRVENQDTTKYTNIGLGSSATEAEYNASLGTSGVNKFTVAPLTIDDISMVGYKYYAWLGITGTTIVKITQGK